MQNEKQANQLRALQHFQAHLSTAPVLRPRMSMKCAILSLNDNHDKKSSVNLVAYNCELGMSWFVLSVACEVGIMVATQLHNDSELLVMLDSD